MQADLSDFTGLTAVECEQGWHRLARSTEAKPPPGEGFQISKKPEKPPPTGRALWFDRPGVQAMFPINW